MQKTVWRLMVLVVCVASFAAAGMASHGYQGEDSVVITDLTLFENETVVMHNVQVKRGTPRLPETSGQYSILLLDGDEVVANHTFGRIFARNGSALIGESYDLFYRIPYEEGADRLEVRKEDRVLFDGGLKSLACVDGDGSCSRYCSEVADDADCDADTYDEGRDVFEMLVGLVVWVILAGGTHHYWKRRRT